MLKNKHNDTIIVKRLIYADRYWRRLVGLLSRKTLPETEGMLLTPCHSVHTFFMRFSIDVVYLDKSFKVLALFKDVKPWRALPYLREAEHILETAAGRIYSSRTEIGHQLEIK